MGVDLRVLLTPMAIPLESLSRRAVAIDAYNAVYQFLAIIRQPDGTPLRDARGRVTSHLSGLFYRNVNFLEANIKPIYVFDGKPPELKAAEVERRVRVKAKAEAEYRSALARGDVEGARKHAQATSRLTAEMVGQAKALLDALGIPWIQAPSEGEAQAAFMVRKGDAWASVSQDYDSLLFGTPRLVRNLTISGRRKLPNKPVYIDIEPEIVKLDDALSSLGVTRDQLIDIGILLGTDFNPDGFRGVGPKKALKLIKECGSLEGALEKGAVEAVSGEGIDYASIREIFLRPTVTDDYHLAWRGVDREGALAILCDEFDFSRERVEGALQRIEKAKARGQSNLEKWFG